MEKLQQKPKVLVLSRSGTGLATIRGFVEGGMQIIAAVFHKLDPVKYSFCCEVVDLSHIKNNHDLLEWLFTYGRQQAEPLVIINSSDDHALLLAENREALLPYYILWLNDHNTLMQIINKDQLYLFAEKSNVPVIPYISEPTTEQLATWVVSNPAPYFLKPFYEGNSTSNLKQKNLILDSEVKLLDYVQENGSQALVIQRLIHGGDGYIFDTYGLCDKNGRLITIASHRRWRQQPPNTGTTSFGEIPGTQDAEVEAHLFKQTKRLLSMIKYHGIFGIEWLLDKNTGIYSVVDFNARPFTSVGHLQACGLNLPLLAYYDLLGEDLSHVEVQPRLKHKYWTDILLDLWSLQVKLADNAISWKEWLKTISLCRCSAYWSWKDPGPGLYRFWVIAKFLTGRLWKKVSK